MKFYFSKIFLILFNTFLIQCQKFEESIVPYHAALFIDGTNFCSGAIISANVVVTAAENCFLQKALEVNVVVGNPKLAEKTDNDISIIATEIYVSSETSLALIKLPINLIFNNYVKCIKIPREEINFPSDAKNSIRTSGWTQIVSYLQRLDQPLRSKTIQRDKFCFKEKYYYMISGENFEDIGSPIVVNNNQLLYAIVKAAGDSRIYYDLISYEILTKFFNCTQCLLSCYE